MIHIGIQEPEFTPDINNVEVAQLVGADLPELLRQGNKRKALDRLGEGLKRLIPQLYAEGKLDGMLSLGASSDTAMITTAMRTLPIGVPKVMVTTMASGYVSEYLETSDIMLMPSIVNTDGLNHISRQIFRNAVKAIAGMVQIETQQESEPREKRPMVAVSVFSLTSPCVKQARKYLEQHGYEVLEFSCTGSGGRAMESLINQGYFAGVLDLTTTEWCDELVGGVLGAGPTRCDAAIIGRVPQVVSVGATDMVNFGPIRTVPTKFARRNLYKHNSNVTLMRTTTIECAKVGDILADKWNNAHTAMAVMLPLKGVSSLDAEGQPFEDPDARRALFETIEDRIYNPKVEVTELDYHINDKEFAIAAAQKLIELMEK